MSKYAFGDIAINSTEKKKPESADKAMYIGLEHLDSGCLTVRRFGADVAPIGDKLVMKKGDVLFGKRRAYQKKVAIAPFDGIFSAHGMVLRPKTAVIDKGFFPLFIASDYFLDAAIKISVGSLSPTINWSDLKRLEFSLPPLDEQKKLAQVLWSAIELKEAYQVMLARCDEMASSRFIEMFGDSKAKFQRLGDICSVGSSKRVFVEELQTKGIPFFRGTEVGRLAEDKDIEPTLFITEEHYIALCKHTGKPKIGDLLLPSICPDGRVWCVNSERPFYFKDGRVLWVKVPDAINGCYLRFALSQSIIENYSTLASGITFAELKIVILKEAPIPLPPLALQNEFAAFIEQLDKSKVELQKSIASTSAMIKSLLSEAMGE